MILDGPKLPAYELACRRSGVCSHTLGQHAPGGAGCLWWDPRTGDHCGCRGFVGASEPSGVDAPDSVCHYSPGQPTG